MKDYLFIAQQPVASALHRICWRSRITGFEGNGQWIGEHEAVQCVAHHSNILYPEIEHWVETWNRRGN